MPFLGNTPSNTFVSIAKQTITGNGGTSYALSYAVTSANDIDVFYNNVRQEPGVAYTATGTTIAFTEAIASTDSVYILYNGQAIGTVNAPEGAYLPTTGGTLNGSLYVNNRIEIQQDSGSNNRLTLRGKPSSSYRWNVDNFGDSNALRIFRENDSDGSSGAVMAQIDSSGRVTLPYQPTFCAYANTTSGYSDSPLKYDVTLLNVGSHYNTSTYRFTAPISGNYFFSFSIWTGSSSTTRCAFYKNGSPVGNSTYPIGTRNHAGAQDNDSSSIIIPLSINDYVDIRCYEGAVAIFGTNYFLGRLIG